MVHIVVEHLLSTSKNRLLYESLWNLAVTKAYKSGYLKGVQDHNISAICNELIQEIKRDDPDRNKLYFSTQIVFGTLVLFRIQVNKLYDQAKSALLAYNSTFYDMNWLSQISIYPSDCDESQNKTTKSTKKIGSKQQNKNPNKSLHKNKQQQKKFDFDTEFALIERVLEIPEPEPKKVKRARTEDETDPTMAISLKQITLIENETCHVADQITNGAEDEEFGAFDDTFGLNFGYSTTNNHADLNLNLNASAANLMNPFENNQEMSYDRQTVGSPGQLRTAESPTLKDFDATLSENIQEILKSHKKSRKRCSSTLYNNSLKLDHAVKKPRIDMELDQFDERNASEKLNTSIPPFDNIANDVGLENFTDSVANTNQAHNHNTFDLSDPSNFIDLALASSKTPVVQVPTRSKKPKLLIDKQTMIKNDILQESFALYKKKFVQESPLDTFELQAFYSKSAVNKLFQTPASRLRVCARDLIPVYERNLKKLSSNLLKRKIDHHDETESLSPKQQRLERKGFQVKKAIFDVKDKSEDQLVVPAELEPTVVDYPIVNDVQLPALEDNLLVELPVESRPFNSEINPVNNVSETNPPVKVNAVKKCIAAPREYGDDVIKYKESEKWSKKKIMNNLNSFWKQKDDSVTMEKLTSQTNRFVAAGIFFELMVLSKVGAVELTQGSDLKIVNISAGKHKKIYM